MLKLNDKEIKGLERDLKSMFEKAVPFAAASALNTAGFQLRNEVISEMRSKLTLRNKFTERSIRVEKTKTNIPVKKQRVIVGSTADYMETVEFGGQERSKGKEGVPLATTFGSGEGENTSVRKKLPRRANQLKSITLKKRRIKAKTKAQRNFIKVKQAIENNDKYVYIETGRRKYIARVVKKGRKNAKLKMVYDLSHKTVTIPANPVFKPAAKAIGPRMGTFYADALEDQIKRQKLFRSKRR